MHRVLWSAVCAIAVILAGAAALAQTTASLEICTPVSVPADRGAQFAQAEQCTLEAGSQSIGGARPIEALIDESAALNARTLGADIVVWLSENFGLPATADLARVELVSAAKMSAVRTRGQDSGKAAASRTRAARAPHSAPEAEVDALYEDASRTIYLHDAWTGSTPAEVSILVHELVHHLQNVAGLTYECPQAREALAYEAQGRWLVRSGRDLMNEFQLDPMTLLVRTKCMH